MSGGTWLGPGDHLFPRAGEWAARWIEPVEAEGGPVAQRPAHHLVGELDLVGGAASAVLHVSAHGIYELFVNGTRVADLELTPGFTAYRKRLQVHSFDVTDLLHDGPNAIGALLSDGWWRGQSGIVRGLDAYGPRTGLLAELHVTTMGGEELRWGTGHGWRSTPSHVLGADLVAGEVHDQRVRVAGWCDPGTDRSGWDPVAVVDSGFDVLCPVIGPPTRRIEELAAVAVTEPVPGHLVVDFGQNSNGWVRLADLGPAGTRITLRYGEALDPVTGDVTQDHIAHGGAVTDPSSGDLVFQTDVVVSAGDGATFEPRHSTKGFRYVRVEGHPGPLDPASITSVVVHSDLRRIGGFECSDDRLNLLHEAAVWSFRGNACEIPTDCPTRERSGWVGDWQLYLSTAAYLYDVGDWSARWLRDLEADQLPDGRVTNIVPDPSPDAPIWATGHGAAGWGDAAVHVPWGLHQATGRVDVLVDQLGSMRRWVDYAAARAAGGRHHTRVERHPEPRPHERWFWDTGWHFGEWLEPGEDMGTVFPRLAVEDHGPVATAYLYRSALELALVGQLLGDAEVLDTYGTLAANALEAWRTELIDDDGHVQPQTQATLVRALAFGLVPDDLRAQTTEDLVRLVREAGDHLGTGFLATPYLLPILADEGRLDVAYDLLLQDTEPSWLYMIDRGATTIWEDWDGLRPDGTPSHSLNHYSKGAVISFLHRYVAGLQPVEAGWRRFLVHPRPGGGLTSARTWHESPQGRIEVAWRLAPDGGGEVTVVVPAGAEADLVLPAQPEATAAALVESLPPGTHRRTWGP